MAPQVGFEPTTDRLTADSSTTELLWNNKNKWSGWWESNPRMSKPQSDALTTSPQPPKIANGSGQNRTADTWSFNPLLYQLSYWTTIVMAVSTGLEPAISCVTGRRVNRYTTRPTKLCIAGGGFEPPTFGLWARRATELLHPAIILFLTAWQSYHHHLYNVNTFLIKFNISFI